MSANTAALGAIGTVRDSFVSRAGHRLTWDTLQFRRRNAAVSAPHADNPPLSIEQRMNAALRAEGLCVDVKSGERILDRVTFDLPAASVTAVIGPSGAGKTTLLRALTGTQPARAGSVWCAGVALYDDPGLLEGRIGIVPQDDIVHRQLTVEHALGYAAEIRLGSSCSAEERTMHVRRVLSQLHLTEHRDKRIWDLSGGQRKRVSVAMELLTEPEILFLDEPTSGLDPALDRAVMQLLAELAAAGRTVVVVTHSLTHLDLCDRVLLMAPGGKLVYDGPPHQLNETFGAGNMADVFQTVVGEPELWRTRAVLRRTDIPIPLRRPDGPSPQGMSLRSRISQLRTLMCRQWRIAKADPAFILTTLALPVVLGLMALTIPGSNGFASAARPTNESSQLLVVMMVGAAFMGAAATIRELVGERAVHVRERAAGLSQTTYLVSKIGFVAALTLIQAILLLATVLARRPAPPAGVVLRWGSAGGAVELGLAIWLTAACAAMMGLAISAWVRNVEQVMQSLVVAVMAQLVLCGGLVVIGGRDGLEQMAWLAPARWGYAAAAAVVDLRQVSSIAADDSLWAHSTATLGQDLAAMLALGLVCAVVTWLGLRRTCN